MKGFKIDEHVDRDHIACPMCGTELEMMEFSGFAMGSSNETAITLPVKDCAVITANSCSQHFKNGMPYFCSHCNELLFVYEECDLRRCKNCKHYGKVTYKKGVTYIPEGNLEEYNKEKDLATVEGCTWFNLPFNTSNGWGSYSDDRNHHHCEHIDDDPVEIDPNMRCFLCKHYHDLKRVNYMGDKVREITCDIKWPIHVPDDMVTRMTRVCAMFEADYEKYKSYRASFEDFLFKPKDLITIPEFDKRIEEEKNNA